MSKTTTFEAWALSYMCGPSRQLFQTAEEANRFVQAAERKWNARFDIVRVRVTVETIEEDGTDCPAFKPREGE